MQSAPEGHFGSESELRHYEALLRMADLVVRHHDLGELFRDLVVRLQQLTGSDLVVLSLHDPAKNVVRVHVLDEKGLPPRGEERNLEDLPSGWAWQNQQPLGIRDTGLESRFPWAMRRAQWTALGLSDADLEKPKIAIVNSSSPPASCFSPLDEIVGPLKSAIAEAGGVAFEVRTAAPSDAITSAGGFTEFAGRVRIRVFHKDHSIAGVYDYDRILQHETGNPVLEAGDYVSVIGSLE